MHIKGKTNGTMLSSYNEGVNESATSSFEEDESKHKAAEEVKCGHFKG